MNKDQEGAIYVECRNSAMGLGINPENGNPIILFTRQKPRDAEDEPIDVEKVRTTGQMLKINSGVVIEIDRLEHIKWLEGYLVKARQILDGKNAPKA